MSRTFKDSRLFKEKIGKKKSDPLQKKYKDEKFQLSGTACEDDLCPDCGALTNFTNGFLVCTECNWSTFETEELNFFDLKFDYAI